jgi:hypothetical protein
LDHFISLINDLLFKGQYTPTFFCAVTQLLYDLFHMNGIPYVNGQLKLPREIKKSQKGPLGEQIGEAGMDNNT